ncbi:amino acid ABC transporter permease [Allopusillimonas soli]|uniref:Amino acid ABC transporter permease n=1 Tax=Allopusillimonas soli TaxID=659016 RepID=A0A853F608_9BURK|nr:amino acid ABC transporter permease [Allopusillimonas soli]NYT35397.1 amino acid ABC transporter permease [Allopusillimonas soli]TEA75813.1 amino acid ABC transporter permease [Allopusillimonas soli]
MNASFAMGYLAFLLQGALWTVGLSVIALLWGGASALVVALCRISPLRSLRVATALYIQLVQGTPVLVIIFLIYFGLPSLGWSVSPLLAASLSLSIYVSAYLGESWRASIQSVPRAQWETAECLALSRLQRMSKVILPQAVRIATPPTVGFMVQIIKNTSLASIVGFIELVRAGQIINNTIFQPFLIYLLIAILYFGMCYPLSILSRRLEIRGSDKAYA